MVGAAPMARRRWATLGLLVLLLAGIGGWWWTRRASDADANAGDEATSEAAAERARIVRDKQAARARGEIDMRPASVSGRVTRADDGKPIAGAIVLLTPKGFGDGSAATPGKQAEPLHARTDAKGDWRIDEVKPGRFALSASARGFLPARLQGVDVQAGQDNTDRDLQLVAGGIELRGSVTDISGGPIEGALVQIMRMDEGNLIDFGRAPSAVLTDDDGAFVASVPRGSFTLTASHPEYVAETEMVQVEGPRTIALVLAPGSTISGIVRALPDGAPVAGAIVFANAADRDGGGFTVGGWGEARVVSDQNGAFELRGLSAGVRAVTASSPTHASVDAVEVALGVAEQVTGIEVWVDRSFRISGFVVRRGAEEEGGLEGVLVGAFSLQPPALFAATAPTAEDGWFEITGVRPGSYMVGAIGEEALPNITGTSAQVVDADVDDLLVVMDPGVTVRGRVEPPMAASVQVTLDTESMGFSDILTSIGNALLRARSTDDGVFELRPVASGKLKLVAEADDGSHGELSIEVGSDDIDGAVIELHPRATLAGRVEDANGKPVAGVTVRAEKQGAEGPEGGMRIAFNGARGAGTQEASTAEDGTFAVKGLEEGRYDVTVSERSGVLAWAKPEKPEEPDAPRVLDVPERGTADVVLTIEARDGVIRGSVVDDEGVAIADAWVTAYREGTGEAMRRSFDRDKPEQREAVMPEDDDEGDTGALDRMLGKEKPVLTDERGQFVIEKLRTGSYTIVAEADRGAARARKTGIAPGSRVALELDSLGAIAGTVELGDKPIEGVSIEVKGPVQRSKQVRDPSGTFRIERLDPGHYEVKASGKQGIARAEVDVEHGKTASVKLELEGYGKLRGIVVDGTGKGIAGLTALAQSKGDVSPTAVLGMFTGTGPTTDGQGRFEIGEVPPGEGTVTFFDRDAIEGGTSAEVSYTIDGGEEVDLGTITAVVTAKVPAAERGELGLTTTATKWSGRPRVKGSDDERPAPDDADHLWVRAVDVGGAAEAAGVEPGDEIIAIDGQQVASLGARTAAALLRPQSVRDGQSVSLQLDRAGSGRTATITAKARKQKE